MMGVALLALAIGFWIATALLAGFCVAGWVKCQVRDRRRRSRDS